MKFKLTHSFILLLILTVNFCSTVKVEDKDSEDDSSTDLETDYDENKNTDASRQKSRDEKRVSSESPDAKKNTAEKEVSADGNEGDDEDVDENDGSETGVNSTLPFAVEGESLRRLQQFILSGVENAIKGSLPMIVRSASETNVSSQCSASFLTLISALRESKLWAFKSKSASPCLS
jgi:hypothetical protein